jgi:putative aldouronate transport system substrate-binding protein
LTLPIVEKPITIKVLIQEWVDAPFNKNWKAWTNLTEATNINFDFTVTNSDSFDQKLKLLYSTDELPDLVTNSLDMTNEFGMQGGVVDLKKYFSIMPNLKKYMDAHPEAVSTIKADNNAIYYAPNISPAKFITTWIYRDDIFIKNKITPPETTDQLHNVLKWLKQKYPDTYPLTSRLGITGQFGIFATIAPQWNSGYNMYFNNTSGKWQYGPIEDGYKQMVMFLNQLYKEGLFDKEFATLSTKQWEDKLFSDKTFVSIDWIYRIDTMRVAGQKINPDFSLSGLVPIYKPGVGSPKISTRMEAQATDGYMIPDNSKYIKEVCKLLDFYYSPGGSILQTFGKVGDTCIKKADGSYDYTPDIITPSNPNGKYDYITYFGFETFGNMAVETMPHFKLTYPSAQFWNTWNKYDKINAGLPPAPVLKYSADEKAQAANLETTINDYSDSQISNFIVNGNFQDWDTFVNKVKSLKVDELIKLYNDVYDKHK